MTAHLCTLLFGTSSQLVVSGLLGNQGFFSGSPCHSASHDAVRHSTLRCMGTRKKNREIRSTVSVMGISCKVWEVTIAPKCTVTQVGEQSHLAMVQSWYPESRVPGDNTETDAGGQDASSFQSDSQFVVKCVLHFHFVSVAFTLRPRVRGIL